MRRQLSTTRPLSVLVSLIALVALSVACSSGAEEKPATPAASVATVTDGAITLVARDNRFEPKAFTAPANTPIRLTLDNKGAALHNFALVGQKGPDGQEIQTRLIPGGQQDSVTFTLPAGRYEFYCTVHPAEMRGTLTVQ